MYSGRSYQNDDSLPTYDYHNNYRMSRKRAGQYQCCSLFLILSALMILVILLVDYAIQNPEVINAETVSENGTLALVASADQVTGSSAEHVTAEDIQQALNWSKNEFKLRNDLDSLNGQVPVGSAMHKHQLSTAVYQSAFQLSKQGFIIAKASQKLYSEHAGLKFSNKKLSIPLEDSWLDLPYCKDDEQQKRSCKDRIYRTIDGSCNNIDNANLWGTAMRPFRRILPADYCDHVYSPRCASNGENLPSARLVSTKLHRPEYENDPRFNVMFAVWGQFIDHDISATALTRGKNGEFLSCCDSRADRMHPECYPVDIPKDDLYYSNNNISCMDFIRSAAAGTCNFGPRQQLNQVSSYLDGSVVYGNTDDLAKTLRSYKGGQLKMYRTDDGRDLLPISEDPNDGCNQDSEIKRGRYCFLSGDARANENLHLTTMHLIMARQHNFVANKLMELNANWSDERIYEESRRIVSAQIQHITYNEFLEPLLGRQTMNKYDLTGYSNGYYSNYNDSVDPSMSNAFATAAFRFAHTLLPGLIKNSGKSLGTEEYTELHRILFNPFVLYDRGHVDDVIKGAIGTHVEKTNRFFSKQVTEHLFENDITSEQPEKKKTCGLDLVSLNIQRGRDHGIAGYAKWRELCNLKAIKSFDDLAGVIDPESITVLTRLYKDAEDIDLYSAALSEYPIDGGMLGPTATCIIAEQFQRLKVGDRYWYENYQQPQAFSIDQLEEIRKTTLSKIICDNADNLTMVPREIMKVASMENRHINCDELSEINFALWAENDGSKQDQLLQKERIAEGSSTSVKSESLKLLASSESLKKGSSSSSKDNFVKLFFSATITGGNVTGTKDGQPVVYFDGKLPAALLLDNIVSPSGWSSNADVVFKANVEGNRTVSGTFSMPVYINNDTAIDIKQINGEFNLNFIYKWGGDANIIIPNKQYKCQVIFVGAKKSSAANLGGLSKTNLKEAPLDVGEESCSVLLKGYPYERSFLCNIFPWWCSNSKYYYWSGELELTIKKNTGSGAAALQMLTKSKPNYNNNIQNGLKNIYTGKLNNGWINLNGTKSLLFPMNIQLPAYVNYLINNTNAYLNIFGREIIWNCDYFHNSLFGKFSLPFYTNGEVVYKLKGKFSANVDTQLSLYKLLIPSMQYSTHIHLQDQRTNQIINVTNYDADNFIVDTSTTISSKLILLGNHTKSNTFEWAGKFIILLEKVPNFYF